MSEGERKELNLKAGRLLKSLGITVHVKDGEYDVLRDFGFVGYASYYLKESWYATVFGNVADETIYKQLLEIDSKLGTTQSEQLFCCLRYSPRIDLIEV